MNEFFNESFTSNPFLLLTLINIYMCEKLTSLNSIVLQINDVGLELPYKTPWLLLLFNVLVYINNNIVTYTHSLQSIH